MKQSLKFYGKSQFAKIIIEFLGMIERFSVDEIEHCPNRKVNGPIIFFLDGMSIFKVIEFVQTIKKSGNDCIFISTFSNEKIILGTTFLSKETACFDSVLYHLLYNKLDLSDDEFNDFCLPDFNSVLNNSFYNNRFQTVANKLLREVNIYFSKEVLNFEFINKIELFQISTGNVNEEFIVPIFEKALDVNKATLTNNDYKTIFSDFLNSEKIIKQFKHKQNSRNELKYKSVGVIGGGTAGYFTALALKQKFPDLDVTIIESSKIPIIGVGEATTPIIKKFLFQELKINKLDFYSKVQPTRKLGIKFFWGLPNDYYFNYPFAPANISQGFLSGNVNDCNLNSVIMSRDSSLIFKYRGGVNDEKFSLSSRLLSAYHLDNKKFILFLKEEANLRGVQYKDTEVDSIVMFQDKDGVDFIKTKEGEDMKFDFYADCTGFNSLIMGKNMKSKYISYRDSLYTDSAIVAKVPNNGLVKPYTLAESMTNGWCWNIPLRDSDHRGYVFCSDFCSEEDALVEMRKKNPTMGEHKLVKFKSGRLEHFVKANVVAIGNSHGFVEPLESTGIHMIIKEIQIFRDNFELLSIDKSDSIRNILNENINGSWDYLRWFLAIHYKFNKKYESDFWRDCRENVDISGLEQIIDTYKNLGFLNHLPQKVKQTLKKHIHDDLFGLAGIDNILLGQGIVPKNMKNQSVQDKILWQHHISNWNKIADSTLDLSEELSALEHNPLLL